MDREIELYMKQKGFENVKAIYNTEDKSVKILMGSNISNKETSTSFSIKKKRQELVENGYIAEDVFVKDYVVECKKAGDTALSTAAKIILNRQASGPIEFLTITDGQKVFIKKILDVQLVEQYIRDNLNDSSKFTLEKQKNEIEEFKNKYPFENFINLSYHNYHALEQTNKDNMAYLLEYEKRYRTLCYTSL